MPFNNFLFTKSFVLPGCLKQIDFLSVAADMKIIYRNQCHKRLSISTQYTYNSGSYRCLCQVKLTIRVIPLALELKPFIMSLF